MKCEIAELRLTSSRVYVFDSIRTYKTIKQLRKSHENSFHVQEASILHSLQFMFLCSSLEGFIHTVIGEYYSQIKLIKGLNKSFKNKNNKKILDGIIELYSAKDPQANPKFSILEYLLDGANKNITKIKTGNDLAEVFNLNVLKKYTGADLQNIPIIDDTIRKQRNDLIHGKISYDRLGSTLTEDDLKKLSLDIFKLCKESIFALEKSILQLKN
ncbi:MAG: HEPN domain-containing protein [bacterium]